MRTGRLFAVVVILISGAVCVSALAGDMESPAAKTQAEPGACPPDSELPMAFWIGHWDVYAGEKLDGHSWIENTLQGCAVLEHWDDASGFKGMSLFYFEPHAQQWKQVWLTDHARTPGGTKEKELVYATADMLRFQGVIWPTPERRILDRTTLRKLAGDRVSQVIEISKDGGSNWEKVYDAVYRRAPAIPKYPMHSNSQADRIDALGNMQWQTIYFAIPS